MHAFLLTHDERDLLVKTDPKSADVIHPYLIGRELLTAMGSPRDSSSISSNATSCSVSLFPGALPESNPCPARPQGEGGDGQGCERGDETASPAVPGAMVETGLGSSRSGGNRSLGFIDFLFAHVSRNGRYSCLWTMRSDPGDALQAFAFADDYSFGILQSNAHWQWFIAKCSKLKSDFRYTPESVFDTFPWPQCPTLAQIDAVAEAGRQVRRVRADALSKVEGGLRAVYRLLELPGKNPLKEAQDALDGAVLAAYGFSPKKDLLAQLLALNLEVARREEAGEPVTAPGIPTGYPEPARLVTEDCICSV